MNIKIELFFIIYNHMYFMQCNNLNRNNFGIEAFSGRNIYLTIKNSLGFYFIIEKNYNTYYTEIKYD